MTKVKHKEQTGTGGIIYKNKEYTYIFKL